MADNYFMGLDGFIWFTGVVEDRNDPAKLGRVRVRCLGFHTEDRNEIPTEDLPWAHVMHTIHDPSMQGMGTTPSFIVEGTWVVGWFRDSVEKQQPIVMGTLPGYPQLPDDMGDDKSPEALQQYRIDNNNIGFNDPNRKYPQYPNEKSGHDIGESDVNRLARGDGNFEHRTIGEKANFLAEFSEVETAQSGNFGMPYDVSSQFSRYPFNHVFESESGHIREYDDTFNQERIHEYHKAGTFYEIDSGGNKIVHVVGDNYSFVAGNDYVNVKGDVNITVEGNAEVLVKEDYNIRCKNLNIEVEEDFSTLVRKDTTQLYKGKLITTAMGAVSNIYNETFDNLVIGAVTDTYGDTIDRSVTGAVTERFGSTIDRSVVGVQTDIHAAEYNINSTTGGININSVGTISLFSTDLQFRASSGITLDASDINLNSGGSTDLAARKGDTADQGDDPAGISGSDGSNVIETGSATVKIGSADPGVGDIAVASSELKLTDVTKIIDNDKNVIDTRDELVDAQGPLRTDKGGTGGYNPNSDGDYPVPNLLVVPERPEVKATVEEKGIDTTGFSVAEDKQALKNTTETKADLDPALAGTEEGKELANNIDDTPSFEIGEPLPPITAESDDSDQNQYRSYLGVPTKGKKGKFNESEITDEIRERYSNKYFPKEILYTADDQEVVRGVKQVGQIKQEGYRIPQLRGLPRLRIKQKAGVTMTGTKPEMLAVAEKAAFDIGKQLILNSAFRSKKGHAAAYKNSNKKPPKTSKHLIGEALDVRVREFNNKEKTAFVEAVIRHGAKALGFYGGRFIHIDLGPNRFWTSIPKYARPAFKAAGFRGV